MPFNFDVRGWEASLLLTEAAGFQMELQPMRLPVVVIMTAISV